MEGKYVYLWSVHVDVWQIPPQYCKSSESHSVMSNSLQPHGLYSPWNSPGQRQWSGQPFPSPGDLPNPGTEPRSPTLQVDSLPAEPQGKPKNTGVGSLSLLQWLFLTQESNQGLLLFRQILHQLSYQGSPLTNYVQKIILKLTKIAKEIHTYQKKIFHWVKIERNKERQRDVGREREREVAQQTLLYLQKAVPFRILVN